MKPVELKDLEQAFRSEQPSPDPARRAEAISRAVASFRAKNSQTLQGTGDTIRQTIRGNKPRNRFEWRNWMNLTGSKLTGTLAAGASLAVISFAVMNTLELQPWQSFERVSVDDEPKQAVPAGPEVTFPAKPKKDETRMDVAAVEESKGI